MAGLLFVFLTPPFQVPDEVGHFWRASAIAEGYVVPSPGGAGSFVSIPEGTRMLVFFFYKDMARKPEVRIEWQQFRASWDLALRPEERARVRVPAAYTPVAYAPQVVAAGLGRLLSLRPVITFYLGRILNLFAFLGIVALAIRTTPRLKSFFAAAALLPMALFLGGSWSPDAMTIASSFLFLALLLRGFPTGRNVAVTAGAGLLLGLCKPAYFLIALLAFPNAKKKRAAAVVILAATLAGVTLSMANAARAYERNAVPGVSPREQLAKIVQDPLRFAEVLAVELRVHGFRYIEQMVGRLGMLEINQPLWLIWTEIAILAICTGAAGGDLRPAVRIAGGLVFVLTAGALFLAFYLNWTTVGADHIEGLQGRYFLPILPLVGVVAGASVAVLERVSPRLVIAGAAICNTAAVISVAQRFY